VTKATSKVPPRDAGPTGRVPRPAVLPQLRQPGLALGPRAERTIAKILDATRQIFLARGYAGTTVDEITRVAGVSRGSFYTYFPSKRDVFLVLGGQSLRAGSAVISTLGDGVDLEAWLASFFAMLDDHGSFSLAWTQAAHEDEEIRVAGMAGHLELCRRLGVGLCAVRHHDTDDPTALGLAVFAMLERAWTYAQLYVGAMDLDELLRAIQRMLA
jgi:AcrR family transcriptional regulator